MHHLIIDLRCAHIVIEVPPEMCGIVRNTVFSALIQTAETVSEVNYKIDFSDGRYALYRKKRMTHRNRSLEKILYALEWQIVEDLLRFNKDALKIHSAVMEHDGSGWMFIGNSGSGKTSLSIFLMRHGWTLHSDEFGLIHSDLLEILPFPRNFIIKPHLQDFVSIPQHLPPILLYDDEHSKYIAHFLSPTLIGSVATRSVALKKIVFLEDGPGDDFELLPVEQNKAFITLCNSIFNYRESLANLTEAVASILNQTSVYSLKTANPLTLSESKSRRLMTQLNSM